MLGLLLFVFNERLIYEISLQKPSVYLSMYDNTYICDRPVYDRCTLYQIDNKGLAVIQQRYDQETKTTWWSEIDPWLTDTLYLHPKFKEFFR